MFSKEPSGNERNTDPDAPVQHSDHSHNAITCIICTSDVTKEPWIHLTDGSKIHSACYDQLSSYISDRESELDELKERQKELERKRKIELGFIAKVRRFFYSEVLDEKLFWSEKLMLSQAIDVLSISIDQERKGIDMLLLKLHDFWPGIPPDWEDRRRQVIDESDYCMECGKHGKRSMPLHVHHIVPISRGGSHRLGNLVVLCERCHQRKHPGKSFPYRDTSAQSQFHKRIETIQTAMGQSNYLKFNYRLYSGEKDLHIVKPIRIERSHETVFLHGFCYLSNQERKFSINKISNISILEDLHNSQIDQFPSDFIDEAISKGKLLYFHYTKGTGGRSWRTIKPTHYEEYRGMKVISGYDYLTQERRNFAPQRMTSIEVIDVPRASRVISGTP